MAKKPVSYFRRRDRQDVMLWRVQGDLIQFWNTGIWCESVLFDAPPTPAQRKRYGIREATEAEARKGWPAAFSATGAAPLAPSAPGKGGERG